ncbi:MAG: DUF47 domain-containing protein [Armatimonadota bacterium]
MARLRLLPRDERFFTLFDDAANYAVEGVDTLQKLLADIEHIEAYRKQMSDIEHAADKVNHEAMDKINRTFVTPIDPEDIRAISNGLDDIIDSTMAAVERFAMYRVKKTHPGAYAMADVLLKAVIAGKAAVGGLGDLRQRKEILTHCIEINRLENDGDRIYREALGGLFDQGDMLQLLCWKEIFEHIEQAIDYCEDLADAISVVITKHS